MNVVKYCATPEFHVSGVTLSFPAYRRCKAT